MKKLFQNKKTSALSIAILLMSFSGILYGFNQAADYNTKAKTQVTTWFYESDAGASESDFRQASNWTMTDPADDCGGGSRPCQLHVDATNETQLQSYLNSIPSSTSILSVSDGTKE